MKTITLSRPPWNGILLECTTSYTKTVRRLLKTYWFGNDTWRSIDVAIGTLFGGLLLMSSYLSHLLIFTIFSLALMFLFHWGTAQRTLKYLFLWK